MGFFSNKTLIIILGLGLAVRLVIFFYNLDNPRFFWDDDTTTYIYVAENLRLGNGFSVEKEAPFRPDPFRTPGYHVFLLVNKFIFNSYSGAIITQLIVGIIIAYIIYLIAKKYGNTKIGYISAAIFLFMPFSIQINLKFLTQTFFTLVLMLVIWYWLKFLKQPDNYKYLLFTAFLLPILALIRPVAQFILLPFFIFILIFWIRNKIKLKKAIQTSLILLILFFAGILPWLFRNYMNFGYFSLSSITSLQLYFYDAPAVYASNHKISYGQAVEHMAKEAEHYFGTGRYNFDNQFSSAKYLKEKAIKIMFESPMSLVKVRLVQLFKFFTRDGIHYWFGKNALTGYSMSSLRLNELNILLLSVILERAVLFIFLVGMLISLGLSLKLEKEKDYVHFFLILIIFYFGLISGVMSSAGLRYPVEAIYIYIGLSGLRELFVRYKNV